MYLIDALIVMEYSLYIADQFGQIMFAELLNYKSIFPISEFLHKFY